MKMRRCDKPKQHLSFNFKIYGYLCFQIKRKMNSVINNTSYFWYFYFGSEDGIIQ